MKPPEHLRRSASNDEYTSVDHISYFVLTLRRRADPCGYTKAVSKDHSE